MPYLKNRIFACIFGKKHGKLEATGQVFCLKCIMLWLSFAKDSVSWESGPTNALSSYLVPNIRFLSQRYKSRFTHTTPLKSLIKDRSISYTVRTTIISQTDKAISIKKTNTWINTWSYFSTTFHKNKVHCWWVLQWESLGTPCSTLSPSALLSFLPLSPPSYLSIHKLCPHLSSLWWGFMYTPVYLASFCPSF